MDSVNDEPPETSDVSTTPATPEQLAAAATRWGLGKVPSFTETRQKREQREKSTQIRLATNPLDVARAFMRREVPKAWEAEIRQMSPKSDVVPWLYLTWKATPKLPDSGRWVLYSCVPLSSIPQEMAERLGGIPYWEMPVGERAGREKLVSAFQWEMFRLHKVWAKPFWCIQGEHGGTPLIYTEMEQKYLKLAGQPTDPPARGALSYAPWDQRVVQAVQQRDRLYKVGGNIGRLLDQASDASLKAETEAVEKQYRKDFMKWWADRLQPQSEFLQWYTRKTEADHSLRRQTRAEFLAAEQLEDAYVETGFIPNVR